MGKTGAVYFLLVCVATAVEGRLLAHKCCPANEQLSSDLRSCVPYESNSSLPLVDTENASDLAARDASFLWWMNDSMRVYDPHTLEPVDSLPVPGHEGRFVKYGGNRSCEWSTTKYVSTRLARDIVQLRNGTLLLQISTNVGPQRNVSLDPEDYCSDRVYYPKRPEPTFVYLLCPCKKVICINKCCSRGRHFQLKETRKKVSPECTVKDTDPWVPTFYENTTHRSETQFGYIVMANILPSCPEDHAHVILKTFQENGSFWILSNGSVIVQDFGFGVPYLPETYCAEKTLLKDDRIVENILFCQKTVKEL